MGADVSKEFEKAVAEAEEWKPGTEEVNGVWRSTAKVWAKVCVILSEIAFAKNAPIYRYLATRELLE
jgi:hypothetical protein